MPEIPPMHGRPTQPPGLTYLCWSPNGKRLITAGCGNYAKSFRTGDDGEPNMLIETSYDTYAAASGNDYVILGAEDGIVCQYVLPSGDVDKMLYRSTLPIRDVALHPEEKWVAVSSDELGVKIINRHDTLQTNTIPDMPKPVKHMTFNPQGTYLACSCTNGIIYIYKFDNSEPIPQPTLFRTVDGVIPRLEAGMDATSRCVWHPDGRTFVCPTPTHDLQVISLEDGAFQRIFAGGHNAAINSVSWSPNGALVASASGDDDQLVIWNAKDQSILKKHNYAKIIHVTWHTQGDNLLAWTDLEGETFINYDFLTDEAHIKLLKGPKVRAPYFHDPLDEPTRPLVNGLHKKQVRAGTPDSLDEMLGPPPAEDEYDWIDDDDNAGYTNGNGKRGNGHLGDSNGMIMKRPRHLTWRPRIHPAFQPGSTPWRGNRKYLCGLSIKIPIIL